MNKRKPLTSGVCDICHKEPASIPFDGVKYCYKCFNKFWAEYMRRANNVKKQRTEKEKAIEKIKKQAISSFLRNRINLQELRKGGFSQPNKPTE